MSIINNEHLVSSSSLFTREDEDVIVNSSGKPVVDEELSFIRCREIRVRLDAPKSNLILTHVYPDSLLGIMFDKYLRKYFIVNLTEEIIFEVPLDSVEAKIIARDRVVFKVLITDKNNVKRDGHMEVHGRDFEIYNLIQVKEEENIVHFCGKKLNIETKEIKVPEFNERLGTDSYYYKDYGFVYVENESMTLVNEQTKENLLIADTNGLYLGYYLPFDSEGYTMLGKTRVEPIRRLSIVLTAFRNIRTGEEILVTAKTQNILNVSDFLGDIEDEYPEHQSHLDDSERYESEAEDDTEYPALTIDSIPMINGVAMLMQVTSITRVFNVFTPRHQRIILEPKYKIDTKSIGNGIFFPEDNVILLDNGSLLFSKSIGRNKLLVRGKEVKLPISYLSEDYVGL